MEGIFEEMGRYGLREAFFTVMSWLLQRPQVRLGGKLGKYRGKIC